ncbi:CAP domain-containing protein [Anaeromyxobacter terrae]|uniref:CAP domain-containing protein n=1 Tax=Anaeromyxobacter terrae TaxID=2925406 RepID=UPI001F571CC7|nr:CAP domain-containing protein [Anaeromyxobacter sp. SG22]
MASTVLSGRSIVAATAAGALLLASACAAIESSRHRPGVISDGTFRPARDAATHYGPDPSRSCPAGGAIKLLADQLGDAARRGGRPPPGEDGRLCAAADTFLGWGEDESPPESVVTFVSSYFGLASPIQQVNIATIESEDTKVLAQRMYETAASFAANARQTRFGVATTRLKKNSTRVVLLLQDVAIELDPLPRRLGPGEQAALTGRLLGELQDPKVVSSDVRGQVSRPEQARGKQFRADVRCGEHPGRVQVEIRAQDPRAGGERTVATIPIACNTELPTAVAVGPTPGWPAEVAAQERKLFDIINAERTTAGLSALRWDDGIAKVAREYSESLRDQRIGADSRPVDIAERLRQLGVASPLVLLNPGLASSAEQAHERFLESPEHRANYMNPELTTGAVGLARATEPDGRPVVVVNELFIKELPPVDPQALRAELRAAIAKKRVEARAAPLSSDPALERLAQDYATGLAEAGGAPPKRAAEITAALNKRFRRVNLLTGAKAEPLELAQDPNVVAQGQLLGVGVAQGMHPVLGRNAAYVVVMVGTRR